MRHTRSPSPRRKAPHHVIIARGDKIRSFTLRPWATMGIGVFAVLFLGLYLAGTAYLFFRDDVLNASLAKQTEIRQAYEERITQLRAQLDRVSSRQVVDQEAIVSRLEDLMGRQDAIAARQQMLTGLAIAARGAGVELPGATPPAPPANPVRRERQAALGSALPFAAFGGPIDKIAALQPAVENATPLVSADPSQAAEMLNQVALTLDLVEQDQLAAIQAVSQSINGKADLLANTLQSLGHRVPLTNLGGPYVPIEGDANDFRDGVAAVSDEIELLAGLVDAARQLPLARPIEVTGMTSGFGRRLDPFLRRPAMHTGVDFGAASGTTVRATGPGRVIVAGRNGGYGKMVEIDHGNGLTTRYAHMSRISVKVGDVVDAGTMVGRVGSTGRSTGPHLHYEVRRSGRAIDPIPYLRAGDRIISLL